MINTWPPLFFCDLQSVKSGNWSHKVLRLRIICAVVTVVIITNTLLRKRIWVVPIKTENRARKRSGGRLEHEHRQITNH